jgi:DNA polymerase elongation subunit (family B)
LVAKSIDSFNRLKTGTPLDRIVIESERVVSRLLLVANKCYAFIERPSQGLDLGDIPMTIKIKGLVSVKANVPRIVRLFQMEVVRGILGTAPMSDPDEVADMVRAVATKYKLEMMAKRFDVMDYVASQKTGRPEDRKTGRPEDRKTGRPEDRKTGRPEDRKTGRPEDRGRVEQRL